MTDSYQPEESWISRLLRGASQRHYRAEMQPSEVYDYEQELKELRQTNDKLRRNNEILTGTIAAYKRHSMETSMTKITNTLPELPIALRPGFNVLITGLPTDMTQEESDYISGILWAYSQRPSKTAETENAELPNPLKQPISKDLDKSVQKDIDDGMVEALNGPEAIRKVMANNASIIGNQPAKHT